MFKVSSLAIGVCLCVGAPLASVAEGATLNVAAGGNLQAALNAAQPGDVILLAAGATFTGPFDLPAKGGTAEIIIRSAAPDSALPAPGVRISPAFASKLPKIVATPAGAAMRTVAAASYWRLQFLEFLPNSATSSASLVEFGSDGSSQSTLGSVPHHLTVDRCYLHGDPGYGQRRGLGLNSANSTVIDSYFADFKQANQDTQAIGGWNGPGPFLIENNYLEAGGENVMFGGSDPAIPNLVPSNITIRRNLISKPLSWRSQNWTVKNLIEFKNARSVLVEGNTIENNWTSGQSGYAIMITPRNQTGTAPWSVVRDIVIQNNVIRHVAGVFNILGYDDAFPSQQTVNITIRNNLAFDVSTVYGNGSTPGPGRLALIGGGPQGITFDHNTIDNDGDATIYLYGGYAPAGAQIGGFVLTNNLLRDNAYGIFGDNAGLDTAALNAYTINAVVQRNTFAGGAAQQYPAGNMFPTIAQWRSDFVAAGSDYRLVASSLSRNAGTDGKDLGVDFAALGAATLAPPTGFQNHLSASLSGGRAELESYLGQDTGDSYASRRCSLHVSDRVTFISPVHTGVLMDGVNSQSTHPNNPPRVVEKRSACLCSVQEQVNTIARQIESREKSARDRASYSNTTERC